MNAKAYLPVNRFSDRVTVAQAAVEWHGLPDEQQALVIVDAGMPYIAGVPDLTYRAEAIVEAAALGRIAGLTTNEDGYPLRPDYMSLDKSSVRAFTASLEAEAS